MKNYPGFNFNLGHGVTPNIDPKKIEVMNKDLVVIEDNTIGYPASVEIHFNCK